MMEFTDDELRELEVILTHFIINYPEEGICIPCDILQKVTKELIDRRLIQNTQTQERSS